MAGDWIKFEAATPDKPEIWQIADDLGIDPDAVVGKLLRLWIWFDQQTENGNAPSVTKKLLDRNVGVTGFCSCVISCGWMEDDGETLTLVNFARHNGKTAKNRALTAKRVANNREKSNAKCNGASVTSALPREEKRREDNNIKSEAEASDEKGSKVPYQSIVDQYHERLPMLPGVKKLTAKRKTHIKQLFCDLKSIERCGEYFEHCKTIPFLMGSNNRGWRADFDFVINPNKFVKICEGGYNWEKEHC